MSEEHPIEREIKESAGQIGQPSIHVDLMEAQVSYWMSIQSLMKSGGYEAVRKRTTHVSEQLAELIEGSSLKAIHRLCLGEISTLRPNLPEQTLRKILEGESGTTLAKMTLQILTEKS